MSEIVRKRRSLPVKCAEMCSTTAGKHKGIQRFVMKLLIFLTFFTVFCQASSDGDVRWSLLFSLCASKRNYFALT